MQNITLATVKDNFGPNREGSIWVLRYGEEDLDEICMSSPYETCDKGTFKVPIPRIGSTVVVCKPTGSPRWIYLATCPSYDWIGDGVANPLKKYNPPLSVSVDRGEVGEQGNGYDGSLVLQNDEGCGLKLSQTKGPKGNRISSELYTGKRKKIKADDSTFNDAIILDTNAGSSFRLTGFPSSRSAPRKGSILNTIGSQHFISQSGDTHLVVQDGGELNLINNSTGFNAFAAALPFTAGNINLQSKRGDINLLTSNPSSKIFIECLPSTNVPGADLPVNEIVIRSGPATATPVNPNRVIIEASEIQLTTNNLSVNSLGTINMTSAARIAFAAPIIDFRGGTVNIDTTGLINLNSGTASSPLPDPGTQNIVGLPTTTYFPAGVSSYSTYT